MEMLQKQVMFYFFIGFFFFLCQALPSEQLKVAYLSSLSVNYEGSCTMVISQIDLSAQVKKKMYLMSFSWFSVYSALAC